jgi:hypothetical protein
LWIGEFQATSDPTVSWLAVDGSALILVGGCSSLPLDVRAHADEGDQVQCVDGTPVGFCGVDDACRPWQLGPRAIPDPCRPRYSAFAPGKLWPSATTIDPPTG